MKKILASLLLIGSTSLFAQEPPDANDTEKRIVILGDSITAGYGLDPQDAYPAQLQEKITKMNLRYFVTNAGVSGDTTAGGLRRVAWAMGKGADIFIIALGGNDGLRGISPEETKKNLLGIVEKTRTKHPEIKIFIAGMQMPDNMGPEFTTRYKAIFSEAAEEASATLIPHLLEGVGGVERLNQPDGIHPTAEGQKKIAETVWKFLEQKVTP